MLYQVGKLAPQIGDYDPDLDTVLINLFVGKLAPQIGDYDVSRLYPISFTIGRKTCPTNRGLRLECIANTTECSVGKLAPQIGDYDLGK